MTPHELDKDTLSELQLQVARRADELAASLQAKSSLNLPCWFQAEEEILGAFRNSASGVESSRAVARESEHVSHHSWASHPPAFV